MTSLRSALAAAVLALVGTVGALVATAPGAAADSADRGVVAADSSPHGGTTTVPAVDRPTRTAERGETLGLVAGGAGALIVVGIVGGAWRYHRDPGRRSVGH